MTRRRTQPKPSPVFEAIREFADVLVILLVGGGLALASILAPIKDPSKLAAATLAVLSVLAVAVLRERLNRRKPDIEVAEIRDQLAETSRTMTALKVGRPYHVLVHDTTWDLVARDGGLAHVTRTKELVFDQPDVVALYDFFQGPGRRSGHEYTVGKIADDELIVEGKRALLISLGRQYSVGDKLTFGVKRTTHGGFLTPHEYVSITTRDLTALLQAAVIWPATRPPSAVKLVTIAADRKTSTREVWDDVEMQEGRPFYRVEVETPEMGSTTMIEWDW